MTGKVQITLKNGQELSSDQDETILESALKQGYSIEHSCKTGTCGICETTILDADSQAIIGDKILTCCYKPSCSLTIDSEYFEELKDIKSQVSPAKVDEIVHHTDDVICLLLRVPPRIDFKYLPGQYLDLTVQGTKRSYSIASKPRDDKRIELHFKKVSGGEMSNKIFAPISVGQLVQIEGPKGTFFERKKTTGPLIFLATGTGFAPVKSLIESILARENLTRKVYVYWGNRSADLFYGQSQLAEWSDGSDVIVHLCLSKATPEWDGRNGYVHTCLLEDDVPLENAEVYACGSLAMIGSARECLIEAGLNPNNFYSDAFVAS